MTGFLLQPRFMVNGYAPIECSVHISCHQSADTFSALFALDDPNGQGASYWAGTAPIAVTIMGTNDISSGGYTQLFQGNVDNVELDFASRTVHVSGRDMTSGPIDSKTNEQWKNKQPQDVISDLAQRSGLSVEFKGTGGDKAGLQYKDDFTRISELDSHWNMIVKMAKQLGCIASVNGTTLTIAPFDQASGSTFTINYQPPTADSPAMGDVLHLSCCRNLNLAKTVTVNHKSWQHKQGQAIQSTYTAEGTGGTLDHSLKAPNLTKKQQDAMAQARVNEIISHERTINVTTYGDVSVGADSTIQLTGTGTAFDQSYIVSDIEHHCGWDSGYIMHITGRNKDSQRGAASQSQ